MQGNDDQSVNQAKLYVGNLPYSVMDEELRELFAQFGEVVDAVVIKHSQNGGHLAGKSKGFGFVTMSTAEEAQAAVEAMNEKEVDGRVMVVNVARPMQKRERSFGGDRRGGGGYSNDRRGGYNDNRSGGYSNDRY